MALMADLDVDSIANIAMRSQHHSAQAGNGIATSVRHLTVPRMVRYFHTKIQLEHASYSLPYYMYKEEGHDSGVDESTQAKVEVSCLSLSSTRSSLKLELDIIIKKNKDQENGAPSRSTSKGSKGSPRKRTSRSTDPSPMKGRSPQSTASTERKLPMNKVQVGTTASPNLKSVRSKIGSLDNATHRPGGGKVKIESKKIDFSKVAAPRIAAKNETYTPGGGEKKV
ncbi:unnamed protein product, partial [Meganyctiphanes norvegica]